MSLRVRVNGSLLVKYINKRVSIIGSVTKVNIPQKSFIIKTSDHQLVNVVCHNPVGELDGCLVEVHGVVQGKSMILCDHYIVFHSQLAETYDAKVDNDAVMLSASIPNSWV